ncbi:MAG TPA: thiamine phosphate synthase [Pyrinomonadaceae bacterium]|nr:thiamine phosphate synthase [Pyrinomonadaceae bacterium]HMP66450.1 thiamine phosphate synthase [Pyrinomonadaceae bacterium]
MRFDPQRPLIYLVTPGELGPNSETREFLELLSLISIAVEIGIPLIQIREKKLSSSKLLSLASSAREATGGSGTKLLINDRIDIALASGADGVHVPSQGLSIAAIRKTFGSDLLIGVSTHCAAEVSIAKEAGADFAVFGPIFSTPGKGPAKGLDGLREACRHSGDMLLLGIGGIDHGNAASVCGAGAAGFAAIRLLNDRESLIRLATEFLS